MNNANTPIVESEIVLRRLLEPLRDFSDWVVLVPILFAFTVLFFIMLFQQEDSMSGLLKRIFIPRILVTIGTVLWSLYLLAYLGLAVFVLLFSYFVDGALFEQTQPLLLLGLVPIVAYPALLGTLGFFIILFRKPLWLIAVVPMVLISCLYLGLNLLPMFRVKDFLTWWVILIPVLMIAFVYVVMMYFKDAQTIHPLWAVFLALLRVCVYVILGIVFLLPGRQMYNTQTTHSKVLVLFDVSGSMKRVDKILKPGEDPDKHNRQMQIVEFQNKPYPLGGEQPANLTFMQHVLAKSPATAYRFGAVLDDYKVEQIVNKFDWNQEKWQQWLNPDRAKLNIPTEVNGKKLNAKEQQDLSLKLYALYDNLTAGTNVSGSALQAAVRESGHLIQAVIVFSDGQSNLGSADSLRELHARAANPKRPMHIITVGVGNYRQPVSIRVGDIRAPQQARPDDDFKVQVPVYGDGLADKEFTVNLDITRVKKDNDKWVPATGFQKTITQKGKFKAAGEHPYDTVEFDINVRKLEGIDVKNDKEDDKLEGYWQFNARVPRLAIENSPEPVHVSKRPARVLVQKRKLRVFLFAGGPSREYQFVRNLFYREVLEKRVELTIYLQTTPEKDVDQDVPKERLLTAFPSKLGKSTRIGESLSEFDVMIAFDPDWSALDKTQLDLLKQWVGGSGTAGGFILVAGPINTYQLARPGGRDISSLLSITPVKLKDNRLLGIGIGHDSSRPYELEFTDAAKQYGFLNLTQNEKAPLEGWEEFFWDGEQKPVGKVAEPINGMYNYYPVEKLRPASTVLSTFNGPPNSRINDGRDKMPYMVIMPFGAGKSVFIGSGELWRLRQYDEEYHQRFWIKMARFAGSGNLGKVSKYGEILASAKAPTGPVYIEALVMGEDMRPLPPDAKPTVKVVFPKTFDSNLDKETPKSFKLEAKTKTNHQGWYAGKFRVFTPGDYTLKIQIPGTVEELAHDLTVFKPNPETDNPRPDPGHLYYLATTARPLLKRLKDENKQREFMKILQPPKMAATKKDEDQDQEIKSETEQIRLYFPLSEAHKIPDLLVNVPPNRVSTKGAYQDLWDRGWAGESLSLYYVLLFIPGAVGLLLSLILLMGRQWITGVIVFSLTVLFTLTIFAAGLVIAPANWYQIPLEMSAYNILMIVPPAICLLVIAILLTLKRWIFALVMAAVTVVWLAGMFMFDVIFSPNWLTLPLQVSHVLILVVGLLALEWLCRKLLRLA